MPSFKIVTLGCRTNQYESQAYHDGLVKGGFHEAAADESADVCILNTCSVTEHADSKSLALARRLTRENPHSKMVVTGCAAEGLSEAFKNLGVVVVTNSEKENLLQRAFPEIAWPHFGIDGFQGHTRAFVKVQDGCNSFCSYCIVPYVRGRSRSRPISAIRHEVEGLVLAGYQEIVLTGVNLGDFQDGDFSLANLVRTIDAVPGIQRVRLSSVEPTDVDDALADALLTGQHTCPSLHLVLQSGSNAVLKRMNRKYFRNQYLDVVDRLRSGNPDFSFTTDVIVGFPGETEEDFSETLDIIRRVKFGHVHAFPYSPRPRTRAFSFPGRLSASVVEERKSRLVSFSEEIAVGWRERFLGRTLEILTEDLSSPRPGWIGGHTPEFLNVWIPHGPPGTNVRRCVLITDNTPDGLVGKEIL